MFMDKATSSFEKLVYVRCFAEINGSKPLVRQVKIDVEGAETTLVEVNFEWLPPTCLKCNNFGHEVTHCPTKEV